MFEMDTREVSADWAGGGHQVPHPFVLVGYHSPYVANDHGAAPLLIDAEGVMLASGAVYTWCRTGCCTDHPRTWPTIDAAADYHGSYIIDTTGAAHTPAARRAQVGSVTGDRLNARHRAAPVGRRP